MLLSAWFKKDEWRFEVSVCICLVTVINLPAVGQCSFTLGPNRFHDSPGELAVGTTRFETDPVLEKILGKFW